MSTDATWDGVIDPQALNAGAVEVRHALATAARDRDWGRTLDLLRAQPALVNTTRPDGTSLFAPLHQAAHGGAPGQVVEELIGLGAWRTLRNARGERPEDVAGRRGHRHLVGMLAPVLHRRVPAGVLSRMETVFHEVIRVRAGSLDAFARLRLPPLEPLLEMNATEAPVWFAVPGMYGGFSYRLASDGVEAVLLSESWCRVAGGSGQRHEITPAGSRLVAEGFV